MWNLQLGSELTTAIRSSPDPKISEDSASQYSSSGRNDLYPAKFLKFLKTLTIEATLDVKRMSVDKATSEANSQAIPDVRVIADEKAMLDGKAPQDIFSAAADVNSPASSDAEATSDVDANVNALATKEVDSEAIPDVRATSDMNVNANSMALPDANTTSVVNPQVVPDVKENQDVNPQVVQDGKATPDVNPQATLDMNSKAISDVKETSDVNPQVVPDVKENSQISQDAKTTPYVNAQATSDMNNQVVPDVEENSQVTQDGKATADVNGEATSDMNPPTMNPELTPEKTEEPSFHCDFCDAELVYKVAQAFFPGLATACIDHSTGDVFRSAGAVAADIRKEMIDYLNNRGENFVAESVIVEGGPEAEASDHPFDILTEFIDDFAATKRNLLSRVSGWLLSEKREDKIDDFVQEMEINGFWPLDRRYQIAQTLIKDVDFKNEFHCDMKFSSTEDLADHAITCSFRSINCTNECCNAKFSANQAEKHDSICPFKIILCEQNCKDNIMRREMDRHCITVCPMKLVNCPFFPVGCRLSVPYCKTCEHCSENLQAHMMYILKGIHQDVPEEDIKERANQLEESSSERLVKAQENLRSLTFTVKDLDAKLGPIEVKPREKVEDESPESPGETTDEATNSTEKVDPELADSTNKVDDESSESVDRAVDETTESTKKVDADPVDSTKKVDEVENATRKVDDESSESADRVVDETTESTKKFDGDPVDSTKKVDEVENVTGKVDDDSIDSTKKMDTNSVDKVDTEDIHSTNKIDDEAKDLIKEGCDQATNLTKEEEH